MPDLLSLSVVLAIATDLFPLEMRGRVMGLMQTAFAEATAWPETIRLAVNLSPIQFRNRSLVETVRGALAVTGLKRTPAAPEVPTIDEAGVPGYDRYGWYGVMAPAGVPKDAIAKLNAGIVKVTAMQEMRDTFAKQGLDPQTNTPQEFAAFIRSELQQTAKLIKASGAQAN